jgi:hypothetical protein
LLGIRRNFEKSPRDDLIFSEVTYSSAGSRKGETNQTECSHSALVQYARNSRAQPPSSSAINIAIPAVREVIFIAELNTNESFSKAVIATLIMTNHAFDCVV